MGIKEKISSRVITWWAILIFVSLMFMGSISAFAFGLFCFVFLFVEWIRNKSEIQDDDRGLRIFFMFFSIIWFLVNLIIEVPVEIEKMKAMGDAAAEASSGFMSRSLFYNLMVQSILPLAFFFPFIELLYLSSGNFPIARMEAIRKRTCFYLGAGTAFGFLASIILAFLRLRSPAGSPQPEVQLGGMVLSYEESISVLLVLFCSLMISIHVIRRIWSEQPGFGWKREGPYYLGIHIELIVVVLVAFLLAETLADFGENSFMANPLVRFLPLIFLFLDLYHAQKAIFFDLFVKRATFFFLSMAIAVAYFGFFIHYSKIVRNEDLFHIVFWLLWVSLILLSPWLYGRIDFVLDRIWLNRRESPEALIRNFLEEIQFDTEEGRVREKAAALIGGMFNTRAEIVPAGTSFGACDPSGLGLHLEAKLDETETIRLCMEERPSRIPYYAKERLLLNGLLGFLAYHIKVIRLQNAQRQRDMREQELMLDASQSRLKALRAQINPHFLFNALNAIASFTKTDPEKAEKIVELLSEVFRYTLHYSEREWVRLEDELDFISAYLEVEEARFGDRLSADISMEVETGSFLIPSMIVQTLVENAVKHGISGVKRQGKIKISTVTDGTKLWITVWDNGPGFDPGQDSAKKNSPSAGVGLKNIRSRLNGYFGGQAELSFNNVEIGTEAQLMIPVVEQVKELPK